MTPHPPAPSPARRLGWAPAPPDELARLGDEGWPLLDELLSQRPPMVRDPSAGAQGGAESARHRHEAQHEAQRAALRALIDAAFGP